MTAVPAAVGVLVAVMLVVLVVTVIPAHIRAHVPFDPEALHSALAISMESGSTVQDALGALGLTSDDLQAPLPAARGQQYVVGELRYAVPSGAPTGDQLVLFLIDDRLRQPVDEFWGSAPGGSKGKFASGWDGRYEGFAKRYPWLASLAPVPGDGGGFKDPGMAIAIDPSARGPLTFVAALDPNAPAVTDSARDLSFVLGYLGPSGQVYWALRVPSRGAVA